MAGKPAITGSISHRDLLPSSTMRNQEQKVKNEQQKMTAFAAGVGGKPIQNMLPQSDLSARRSCRVKTSELRGVQYLLMHTIVACAIFQLVFFSQSSAPNQLRSPANSRSAKLDIVRKLHSCDELFGKHQIVRNNNGTCLEHVLLQWKSCKIGNIEIDTSRIDGSMGGESVEEVLGRKEDEEKLTFHQGSLILTQLPPSGIENRLKTHSDKFMKSFLESAVVQRHRNMTIPFSSGGHSNDSTFIVRRGNYANPCMAFLTMYNVYTIMEYWNVSHPTIIWLDGHARGNLDAIWVRLFKTTPIHVKQLANKQRFYNGIIVNTMSAIGDEGMGLYKWNNHTKITSTACSHSTLLSFRDFVLDQYGMTRSDMDGNHVLTFLVRKDYVAHPRSNGRTDRTLANLEDDVLYIQSQYPTYSVQVISFEDLPFEKQLYYMTQSDIFVSVHGAGNVNILFLPDHATFVEYFPKGFERRRRFRYLAECLNITYVPKHAWIEDSFDTANKKISVRLRPLSEYEKSNEALTL